MIGRNGVREGGVTPWYWGLDEIKERRRFIIRTPEQFLNALKAIVEYMKNELAKDPDWMPPEEIMPCLARSSRS